MRLSELIVIASAAVFILVGGASLISIMTKGANQEIIHQALRCRAPDLHERLIVVYEPNEFGTIQKTCFITPRDQTMREWLQQQYRQSI